MNSQTAETRRIQSLHRLNILDTPRSAAWDDVTRLAASAANTPIAAVSFVDNDRQWFKSIYGIDTRETPRSQSFCHFAIQNPDWPLIVPDAQSDERFKDNPLVTGAPHIRSYFGIPIRSPEDGQPLGSLCAIDTVPRDISDEKLKSLRWLSHWGEALLKNYAKVHGVDGLVKREDIPERGFTEFLIREIADKDRKDRIKFFVRTFASTLTLSGAIGAILAWTLLDR